MPVLNFGSAKWRRRWKTSRESGRAWIIAWAPAGAHAHCLFSQLLGCVALEIHGAETRAAPVTSFPAIESAPSILGSPLRSITPVDRDRHHLRPTITRSAVTASPPVSGAAVVAFATRTVEPKRLVHARNSLRPLVIGAVANRRKLRRARPGTQPRPATAAGDDGRRGTRVAPPVRRRRRTQPRSTRSQWEATSPEP